MRADETVTVSESRGLGSAVKPSLPRMFETWTLAAFRTWVLALLGHGAVEQLNDILGRPTAIPRPGAISAAGMATHSTEESTTVTRVGAARSGLRNQTLLAVAFG
jgi:hypothetical protein